MNLHDYEAATSGRSERTSLDGHVALRDIEQVLGRKFAADAELTTQLAQWGESVLKPGAFGGLRRSKWKFIKLPQKHRYWVFFSNPRIYDIESALRNLDRDTWRVKKSDVRKGDWVVLWRGTKDGKRGVVGLAEVTSDPKKIREPPESHPFYVRHVPKESERRVWIRMFKPDLAPLWVDNDKSGFLRTLSVAKARGGTIFRLAPEDWHHLVGFLGGWKEPEEDEAVWKAQSTYEKVSKGQGFNVKPEVRKAIDKYAMREVEAYFVNLGYRVEDVHRSRPYDLLCSRASERLHVEVKGTKSKGERILLTSGEVRHARSNAEHMALYIQRAVHVTYKDGRPTAAGGEPVVRIPWDVDEGTLEPLCFFYKWHKWAVT